MEIENYIVFFLVFAIIIQLIGAYFVFINEKRPIIKKDKIINHKESYKLGIILISIGIFIQCIVFYHKHKFSFHLKFKHYIYSAIGGCFFQGFYCFMNYKPPNTDCEACMQSVNYFSEPFIWFFWVIVFLSVLWIHRRVSL